MALRFVSFSQRWVSAAIIAALPSVASRLRASFSLVMGWYMNPGGRVSRGVGLRLIWLVVTPSFAHAVECNYFGGRSSGDRSHSLTCEPVSHWRALRINSSRTAPGGSNLASARRRFASSASRSSRDWVCTKRRRSIALLRNLRGRERYQTHSHR
jgi:hypothetical protein